MKYRIKKVLAGPGVMSGLDVSFDPETLQIVVSPGECYGIRFDGTTYQAEETEEKTDIDVRLLQSGEIIFQQGPTDELPEEVMEAPELLHTLANFRFHRGVGKRDERDFMTVIKLV